MGYLVNLKIALTVQQSPTLLLVTIKAYCGRMTDEGALAGQIASLKTMEGRGETVKPKKKRGKTMNSSIQLWVLGQCRLQQ